MAINLSKSPVPGAAGVSWANFIGTIIRNVEKSRIEALNIGDEVQKGIEYASAYSNAISSAGLVMYKNPIIPKTLNYMKIATGFTISFQTIKSLGIPPTPTQWLPAAAGIISAWMTTQISPLPMHLPATIPTTGIKILFAGEPMSLATGLFSAFNAGNTGLHASILAGVLKIHLMTISGVYNGLMPNPAVVPPMIATPPIPWVGIL